MNGDFSLTLPNDSDRFGNANGYETASKTCLVECELDRIIPNN